MNNTGKAIFKKAFYVYQSESNGRLDKLLAHEKLIVLSRIGTPALQAKPMV